MSIHIGTDNVSNVYVGTDAVSKIYLGTDLIWQNAPPGIFDDELAKRYLSSGGIGRALVASDFGNITKIREGAFCYRMCQNVTLPNSVTEIGDYAFFHGSSICELIAPGVQTIGNSAICAFTGVSIPSVRSIGRYAINLWKLTSKTITLPSTTQYLGSNALGTFSGGSGTYTVYCMATTPPTLEDGVLYTNSTSSNVIFKVPSGSVDAYKSAWSNYSSSIEAI